MTEDPDPTRRFDLADETATVRLAWHVAMLARPGDMLALHGGLGSGKTSFARAFLRARAGDPLLEVPSPTFTLVQVYDLPGGAIWHLDLYRLAAPEEVWELGLEEAYGDAILLVEWAERLGPLLPAERLDVELAPGATPQARIATLAPSPAWRGRIATIPAHV